MDAVRRLDLRLLALAGGVAYALAVTLVGTQADTDPVGADYDAFNRILALAVTVVALSAFAVRRRLADAGLEGRRAATALVIGFALMALGSLVEFWGSLIAGMPASAMADRDGVEAFAGSDFGFGLFAIGTLVAVFAAPALALGVRRWPGATATTTLAAASLGVLSLAAFGLWTVSPLAAAVPGVLFAFALLAVASRVELIDLEEPASGTRAIAAL